MEGEIFHTQCLLNLVTIKYNLIIFLIKLFFKLHEYLLTICIDYQLKQKIPLPIVIAKKYENLKNILY